MDTRADRRETGGWWHETGDVVRGKMSGIPDIFLSSHQTNHKKMPKIHIDDAVTRIVTRVPALPSSGN